MKKTLVLFFMVLGIVLTSSTQAKNIDNISGDWQNKNSQRQTVTLDISESRDLNAKSTLPAPGLIILIIAGFLFAKKHQNLAKKHRDLAKKILK